ncbi:hypothetical protein C6Q01_10570 [Burkholderia multivorans]|nr:hypothetical protein C6Q01_10570 [Burkholderia multivorans]
MLQSYEPRIRAKVETLSSKSDAAKASNYSPNQRIALTLYCEDSQLAIETAINTKGLGGHIASLLRGQKHVKRCNILRCALTSEWDGRCDHSTLDS